MTTHDIQNDCHGLDTPQQVFFYEQDFYVLSNFSAFAQASLDLREVRSRWPELMRYDLSEKIYKIKDAT